MRSIGYQLRQDDLLFRRGIMFNRVVAVPYGRMQYVDVVAGPLERLAGLATVHMHTAAAASDARIPGLRNEEATRLRQVFDRSPGRLRPVVRQRDPSRPVGISERAADDVPDIHAEGRRPLDVEVRAIDEQVGMIAGSTAVDDNQVGESRLLLPDEALERLIPAELVADPLDHGMDRRDQPEDPDAARLGQFQESMGVLLIFIGQG